MAGPIDPTAIHGPVQPPSGGPPDGSAPPPWGAPPPGYGHPAPPIYGHPAAYGPPPAYGHPAAYGPPPAYVAPLKSKAVAALLCFFLGGLGIHRFYTGQVGLGLALLLTSLFLGWTVVWLAVTFVWVLIDFVLILSGGVQDQWGRPLV